MYEKDTYLKISTTGKCRLLALAYKNSLAVVRYLSLPQITTHFEVATSTIEYSC